MTHPERPLRLSMIFPRKSEARAAVLAAAISLGRIEPLGALRYLRIPAVVFVLRRQSLRRGARRCREYHPRRHARPGKSTGSAIVVQYPIPGTDS